MKAVFYLLGVVTFLLVARITHSLVRRRSVARYPLVLAYCVAVGVSCVIEWVVVFFFGHLTSTPVYISYYFANEAVQQLLLYAAMLSMIYLGWEGLPHRMTRILVLGVVVAMAIVGAVAFTRTVTPGGIPNHAILIAKGTQYFSFACALLNIVLWSALIRRIRSVDRTLLLLSAGIGLQTTGKAVGYSIFKLSGHTSAYGTAVTMGSFVLCLVIWSLAFYRPGGAKIGVPRPENDQLSPVAPRA